MTTYEDCEIVVSVSGGKDSTAMCLNLIEQGYSTSDFRRVFADTGWEDASTYEYLHYLEKTVGPIERIKLETPVVEEYRTSIEYIEHMLGFESAMVRQVYKQKCLPNGFQKWCTRLLKIKPFKQFFDSLEADAVNLVGIRKEESARRSKMEEWEYNDQFDCWTHRPLLDWTEQDVIDIHHRFNVLPNQLYLNGFSRVGCYPCVFSNKSELKHIGEQRIKIIEIMERDIGATLFKPLNEQTKGIRAMIDWSKTSRGGKQYSLFDVNPPTCEKWGLCNFAD